MTGKALRAMRLRLGLNAVEMARLLGYRGSDRNVALQIRRYENGQRTIPFELSEHDLRDALGRRERLTIADLCQ